VNGLAVVGFVALLFIGITLAIYAARYLPEGISRLGAANVYFASFFGNEGDNELEVVPGESVPFEDGRNDEDGMATSTDAVATTTSPTPTTPTTPTTPRPTTPIVTAVPVPGTRPAPYGKADLSVRLVEVGYLRTNSVESFVKASRVPDGERAAFRFRVTNTGTNNTGSWEFEAELPTTPRYTYNSRTQPSLAPGEYADFTLGYDRARDGENRVTIEIDSDRDVDESNERNNTLTFEIEVED
jgi:hypothetical protein